MFTTITNVAVLAGSTNTVTGSTFLARTPETFTHDADGNLTQDGRWTYTWDAENRLVRMLSRTDTPTNSWSALGFAYDFQGRRISKVVSNWNGTAWVKVTDQRFVYDGWNLLAILNSDLSLQTSFTWGLDLSGSMQGAGGVGDLLMVSEISSSQITNHFAAFDGNGNVAALVKATDGTETARYEYGPFGELIRATGPMAKPNPFRFSTKYQDDETDFLYYGYRYLNTSTARWLNRDPVTERGGVNLFCFIRNNALTKCDPDGRYALPVIIGGVVVIVAASYCVNYAACYARMAIAFHNAEAAANSVAPDQSTHAGSGARPGNDADALTHCIAACNMARSPWPCGGADRALRFLQGRETGNDIGTQIDRLNNEVGVGVGVGLDAGENCTDACLAALNHHLLNVVVGGVISPSPNPHPE